jgi:hypothetical protein
MICDDNVKENGLGGICSTHESCKTYKQNPKRKEQLEDVGIDGRILLKWASNK